jgi:xanthine/uracil/vitamin C permease (AzgA family)
MLNRLFHLDRNNTTVGRELQAGLTTFAAMAYILAVNPAILANTGMDKGALVTVTALTAAIATGLMALMTNYPIGSRRAWGSTRSSPSRSCWARAFLGRRRSEWCS